MLVAQASIVGCDVSSAQSIHDAFQSPVIRQNPIDVMLYNVAYFQMGGFLEMKRENFEESYKVLALGAALCSQEVNATMYERRRSD
jgi:NAD(P)-dependent dehydrogenase (short-subunit alcohol dehydrogenase family)